MAFDLDKYTSWYDPCIDKILDLDPYIDEIFDLDPYTNTSWIRSLYRHCELEVPMIICNIANEVRMNLLHAYTFTWVINDNC